jgi:hypothetical protein
MELGDDGIAVLGPVGQDGQQQHGRGLRNGPGTGGGDTCPEDTSWTEAV